MIGFGGGSADRVWPRPWPCSPPIRSRFPQYALIDGGLAKITDAIAPIIAIPTTAGTGSEVGRAALMKLADGRKVGIVSPHMIPQRAICDPDLTAGMPPASHGRDGGWTPLSHCIETFLSPRFNPPADAIALDGAGRIMRHLERAVCRWRQHGGAARS